MTGVDAPIGGSPGLVARIGKLVAAALAISRSRIFRICFGTLPGRPGGLGRVGLGRTRRAAGRAPSSRSAGCWSRLLATVMKRGPGRDGLADRAGRPGLAVCGSRWRAGSSSSAQLGKYLPGSVWPVGDARPSWGRDHPGAAAADGHRDHGSRCLLSVTSALLVVLVAPAVRPGGAAEAVFRLGRAAGDPAGC